MKVKLYVRIKTEDGGRKYCEPSYTPNNRLRAGYAKIDGKDEPQPGAVFALRYTDRGKRRWKHVGADPAKALTAKLRQEHVLQGRAIGQPVAYDEQPSEPETGRKLVSVAVEDYVSGLQARRKSKTITAYRKAVQLFKEFCAKTYLDEVTREDLLAYSDALAAHGNGARTVANRLGYVVTFLRHYEVNGLLKKTDKPRYTKRAPNAYSKDLLRRLFEVCDAEERLVFRYFLLTGCREQEVSHACWSDLDLSRKTLTIREKPELGWSLKDYEERSIPLPSDLVEELKARRAERPNDMLIFPTRAGKPQGHFLRMLKRVALRAGLNCGHCRAKNGERCQHRPVCGDFELHRFRRTFATMHHEQGTSVRTLMRWLGHSDIETTLAYLAAADDETTQVRDRVDSTFAF